MSSTMFQDWDIQTIEFIQPLLRKHNFDPFELLRGKYYKTILTEKKRLGLRRDDPGEYYERMALKLVEWRDAQGLRSLLFSCELRTGETYSWETFIKALDEESAKFFCFVRDENIPEEEIELLTRVLERKAPMR